MSVLSDFSARTITGEEQSLAAYAGKVVLVVNVASKCGLTPQYEGLEALYRRHRDQGLVLLGFPCNQFMGQEPGSEAEIAQFCSLTYDVSFPMFSKIEVNGADAHPLYRWLKSQKADEEGKAEIGWNFAKFLIGRDGRVVGRFAPATVPETLEKDIAALL